MNHKKIMQKIMEELKSYKSEIDEMAVAYAAEKKKHEKQLESMRGRYTESYMQEERQNWTPKINYGGVIGLARETHGKIAMEYFDRLKSELDGYFQIPVDSGFAATVTGIKSLNITLSDKEFEVLQGAANGYWGLRLLNEAAISRTKTESAAELENGQPKRVQKEVPKPYTGIELPSIEKAYEGLQSIKNSIEMAFSSYCGENYTLKDVVFPLEKENVNLEKEYGIKPPKQMRDTMTISKMASSVQFFNENYQSYTEFSEIMDSLAATMPKPKRKEVLTDDDKKLIDRLINPNYPALAKDEAIELAQADEHLAELLRLDERYGQSVKQALGEVNENE